LVILSSDAYCFFDQLHFHNHLFTLKV
jgi:hypothetical protein